MYQWLNCQDYQNFLFYLFPCFFLLSAFADANYIPVTKVAAASGSGLVPLYSDAGVVGGVNKVAKFSVDVMYIVAVVAGVGLIANGAIQYYNHVRNNIYVRMAIPISLIFCGFALLALVNIPVQGYNLREGVNLHFPGPGYSAMKGPMVNTMSGPMVNKMSGPVLKVMPGLQSSGSSAGV